MLRCLKSIVIQLHFYPQLSSFPGQGNADEGTGEEWDVARIGTVTVKSDASCTGAEGEGAAGAGSDLSDHGETAAAPNLSGPRDAHLQGMA